MNTNNTPTRSGAPTHIAYQVREHSQQSYWTRIGAAWAHRDGKGFSLQVDGIPLDGRITLREASERQ